MGPQRQGVLGALLLCCVWTAGGAETATSIPSMGLETSRVELILFDVSILDEEGRPVRGLDANDFSVSLGRRSWPIYSVDDLCGQVVPADRDPSIGTAGSLLPSTTRKQELHPAPSAEGPLFVIYFDFSHLQNGGRARALLEARRWIEETMQPGDRVMLAAYATASSTRTLAGFTSDKQLLLEAIRTAEKESDFIDPFATMRDLRIAECRNDQRFCFMYAMSEYDHARRSRLALRHFIEGLGLLPGRKSLLYFHQNGHIDSGSFYGRETPDDSRRFEQLGSSSAEARTVMYPAYMGNSTDVTDARGAMSFGVDMAAYTGGRHNKGFDNVSDLTDEARARASCLYRIGLIPPEANRRKTYPIRVRLRGRVIEDEMRVTFLTEEGRWWKMARTVLNDPSLASDLPVSAELVPVRAIGGLWDLRIRVTVDLGSLTILPSAAGRHERWEVGALLTRDEGQQTWEMLGRSAIRLGPEGRLGVPAVHERTYGGLPPGEYRLTAFVRDQAVNDFGGAEARISLPDPRLGGVIGPVLGLADRPQVELALPELGDKTAPVRTTSVKRGPLPLGHGAIVAGEPIRLSTWVCHGDDPSHPVVRYLSEDGRPVARFEDTPPSPRGDCLRFTERIVVTGPGSYSYHLRAGDEVSASFEIAPAVEPGR